MMNMYDSLIYAERANGERSVVKYLRERFGDRNKVRERLLSAWSAASGAQRVERSGWSAARVVQRV